ncbi:MAG: hypothetical protein HC769_28505 [Cyanobacteria bacterium CRU_2_1]|nr:hypothetical protein [Cyanobacteria bacterium CRU_2_1]
MPRIADYSVAFDTARIITPGGNEDEIFGVNDDANTSVDAILSFRIHANEPSNQLSLGVRLNGDPVFTFPAPLNTEICQTVHEVVRVRRGNNTVMFSHTGTGGRIAISDVVVFFQRDI